MGFETVSGDYADLDKSIGIMSEMLKTTNEKVEDISLDLKDLKADMQNKNEMCYEHQNEISMLKYNQSMAIKFLSFLGVVVSGVLVAFLSKILGLI